MHPHSISSKCSGPATGCFCSMWGVADVHLPHTSMEGSIPRIDIGSRGSKGVRMSLGMRLVASLPTSLLLLLAPC